MLKLTIAIITSALVGTATAYKGTEEPAAFKTGKLRKLDGHIAGTICGDTDDRVQSNDPRVGRFERASGGYCTGWLISDDVFVTAGHCIDGDSPPYILEFNVPLSLSDGTEIPSAPEDRYRVRFDDGTPDGSQDAVEDIDWRAEGAGDDWAVGRLLPNEVTGLLPGQAQSCYFNFEFGAPTIDRQTIITGHGTVSSPVDDPLPDELENVQKTHQGQLSSYNDSTYRLRYRTDTTASDSGAPVINAQTGNSFGIHNAGGCTSGGGSNSATSINQPLFRAAVQRYLGVNPDNQDPSPVCEVDTTTTTSTTTTTGSTSTSTTGSTSTSTTGSTSTSTTSTTTSSTSTSTIPSTSSSTTTSTSTSSTSTTMPTSKASKSAAKASKAKANKAGSGNSKSAKHSKEQI